MTVEQILIKAKNIVENKGSKEKIYDLLLNIEYDPEDYSFEENEKLIFSLYDLQDKIANDLQENFKESKSEKSNLFSLESITFSFTLSPISSMQLKIIFIKKKESFLFFSKYCCLIKLQVKYIIQLKSHN